MKVVNVLKSFFLERSLNARVYRSQYGQDAFLNEKVFRGLVGGFFVDIGAHDGVSLNNTYFFEEKLGWTGICFEPNPDVFEKLARNRKCICLNGAVSNRGGEATFLKIDGYAEMLSGLLDKYDPKHLKRIEQEIRLYGGGKQVVTVSCYELNEVLAENGVMHVDYLSIDAEGSELEILRSVDFERVEYDVISVENNYGDNAVKEHLKRYGFKLIATLGTDEIYVRDSEHAVR
jgi:FkbM family methyltransferase